MLKNEKVYIASAGKKGRGVFARKAIRAGEIIEVAPYIKLSSKDNKHIVETKLNSYWFDTEARGSGIGLGWISIYNHGIPNNAEVEIDTDNLTMTVRATKKISPKEEILFDYGYDPTKN